MAPDILDPAIQPEDKSETGHKVKQRIIKNVKFQTDSTSNSQTSDTQNKEFKSEIRWLDLLAQVFVHAGFLYGGYYLITLKAKLFTYIWIFFLIVTSGIGITAGAHRLWSHKSYKATVPLRLILIFLFTIAGQRDAYTWALDHRIHHKYTETESDPHNAKRGFFFAHIGWLFLTPTPEVVAIRKSIELSDLEADGIVMFQKKFFIPLFTTITILFPTLLPYYFWNECLWISFWTCFTFRFCTTLNIAYIVNSVAHMYGNKPYDENIMSVESLAVSFFAMGEGYHNYHHVFPFDYKTGEYGGYAYNITTCFIDFFARLGWAFDRKSATKEMIARRVLKSGDGSHFLSHEEAHTNVLWGFGDKNTSADDQKELEKMIN